MRPVARLAMPLLTILLLIAVAAGVADATVSVSDVGANAVTNVVTYTISGSQDGGQGVYARVINDGGDQIRTYWLGIKDDGDYSFTWDGKYDNGTSAPEDVYSAYVYASIYNNASKFYTLRDLSLYSSTVSKGYGAAFDSEGNIYISNTANNYVKKIYAVNGTVIDWGPYFQYGPLSLAIDSSDNLYVSANNAKFVKEIYANNTSRTVGEFTEYPRYLAVDSSGNMFVVAGSGTAPDPAYVYEVYANNTTRMLGGGRTFNQAGAIDVGADGYVYVANCTGYTYAPTKVVTIYPENNTTISRNAVQFYLFGLCVRGPYNDVYMSKQMYVYFSRPNGTSVKVADTPSPNEPVVLGMDNSHDAIYLGQSGSGVIMVSGSNASASSEFVAIPTASFSADKTDGVAPLTVQFTDTSTGSPTSWEWSFGDGSSNSTDQNTSHTYTDVGTYTAMLTATNAGGSSSTTLEITATQPAPVASFTANATTGDKPFAVSFTDTSTNDPTSWEWSFGDNTTNSTEQNPSHTYTDVGTYTAMLTATNEGGSSSTTLEITVTQPAPVAAFSANETSIYTNSTVGFADESRNDPTSWSWDFGDNNTSTDQNPSHTYVTAGTYTVVLTATNIGGNDTASRNITVFDRGAAQGSTMPLSTVYFLIFADAACAVGFLAGVGREKYGDVLAGLVSVVISSVLALGEPAGRFGEYVDGIGTFVYHTPELMWIAVFAAIVMGVLTAMEIVLIILEMGRDSA